MFLNFEAPSQCRGNVTSWRFCHYRSSSSDDDDDDQFGAKFIVYRRRNPTSSIYESVPDSITSKTLTKSEASSFSCLTETVSPRFEIQENDIIGGCVWDKGSVNPLYLIGDTDSNSANQRLYQYDRSSYDDCTTAQLGSIDTSNSAFRQRDEWKLHLYVNTGILGYVCGAP